MKKEITSATQPLRGVIKVPGDKSVSHRAVMFGALSDGDTHITGFLSSADCFSTISCFEKLGITFLRDQDNVTVRGKGLYGLRAPEGEVSLYTGNSGTTTRILSGILAPQPFSSILAGDDSVNRRPMRRVIEPLSEMGADIKSVNDNGCAPLRIRGSQLHGIDYVSPVASAQVKSAILMAGLYADGPVSVTEPSLSRDHTERFLSSCGAEVATKPLDDGSYRISLKPCAHLSAQEVRVPGDISSAAFFLVAALLVPGSEVLLTDVGINPTRAGILKVLRQMGADITVTVKAERPEPYADILVRHSALHGVDIRGSIIPALIDELPVIAVAAAFADGTTTIADAGELRVKESDRIAAMTENLRAMGAAVQETPDGMIIEGGSALCGAQITTYADHRIAMSFAVAALAAAGVTVLDDASCVAISYPSFFDDLGALLR